MRRADEVYSLKNCLFREKFCINLYLALKLTKEFLCVCAPTVSPRLLRKAGRSRMRAVALTPLGGAVPEAQEAFPTLQTEVWSWGHCEHGQLGHGDCVAR